MSAVTMMEPRVHSTNTVAKVTEITAISEVSFEDACRMGIERASHTLRNIRGAWVKGQSLEVEDGRVVGYKVDLKLTFVLED